MVVVVIVGLVAATIVLSVGTTGRDSELEKESERAAALLNYAREKSELQTREFGLALNDSVYEFLTYDPRKSIWRSVDEDEALRKRELPVGLKVRLVVEGRPVILKSAADEEREYRNKDKDKRDKDRLPQIILFSNGDLTPFELTLERDGTTRSVTVATNDKGQIEAQDLKEVTR
ncbi:MAG: type II secretion system minor pseudopilin GspH, partial [Gammaproteobacteria bacterium]